MDQNSVRKLVEGQLLRLEGNAFQDCMDRLGLELYPGDYQPVRAAGPKGDTKNDGYCPKARVFFAAHATRGERIDKTKAKIRGDLEGCLQEHRDVKVWRFLTNDTLSGEVDQFIDNELRPRHRGVIIEVWGLKTLADEISRLKREQVERIVDVISTTAKPNPPEKPQVVLLSHMKTGRDIWPILSMSDAWLPAVEPEDCTTEEEDLIDSVAQTITDWLEISGDVEATSRAAVRDAQRGLTELLNELKDKGLAVYAGMVDSHPIGDPKSPLFVSMAVFKVARVGRPTSG
ncbi:hypothetical protein [Streptomyces sp. NPDC005799]|uniref:hypothetical protein n=1 Tax=Streptomyces sp. NPDC005799 TaxID=3154678 RepID=UPI0033F12B98